MPDVIMLRDAGIDIKVDLPDFNGDTEKYTATWMRQIKNEVFEMAFGVTSWIVLIKDGTVTPLSCAMYFTDKEAQMINLGERIGIKTFDIMERVYQERAEVYYANNK
jgi:hypothetical protein